MKIPPKVFVCALEGEPETLDPAAKFYSERATRVKWLLFDALLNISGDGRRLEPGLAEGWTISEGGLRVELTLRADVLFHDGTPLDAEAVKASFERQFAADLCDPKKQVLRELIEEIRTQGQLTLVFKLKYPGFDYLARRYLYKLGVVSPAALKRLGTAFARMPVGTGPFKDPRWTQEQIILSRNAAYWAGIPRANEVHFRFLPDGSEAVERLLTGDVDFVPSLSDPDSIQRVLYDPRVRVQVIPGYNVYYLGFHWGKRPFDNPSLRRAVAHGVDVPKTALYGKGAAAAALGPLPPHMEGYEAAARQASHDPHLAKSLLRQAGYEQSPVVLAHFGPASFFRSLALAVERDLAEIGLTIARREISTWPEFLSAVQQGESDMFLYSWHMRSEDPQGFLRALFHSSNIGITNLTGYSCPDVDSLLDLAPPHDFLAVQKKILDDTPMLFLAHWTRVAAYKTRVKNLRLDLGVLPHDKLVGVELLP